MLLRNDKQPITGSVERGTRSPHGLKELAYMERKSAGNKAHLQPVTHFLVHIGKMCIRDRLYASGEGPELICLGGIDPLDYIGSGWLDVYKRQADS